MNDMTIVAVPDLQVPYHNKRNVANLIEFVRSYKPDMLINVGDDIDAPEVSQWTKGAAGEYAGTLQKAFDEVKRIHGEFRAALGGGKPYHLSRSNHGDRLGKYIHRYAPALSVLRSLDIAELAGYNEHGITYHKKPFKFAPGWMCGHGDEGTLSKIPGKTASALAEKWGMSVLCGHTHRAAIMPISSGVNGTLQTRFGMEIGHMMDVSKAGYLKGGNANWQSAFGILHVRKGKVHPQLVYLQSDGSFVHSDALYPEYSNFFKEMEDEWNN